MQVTKFFRMFFFAIAPAASGKGALKFAKMLADEYHSFVLKASREAESQYNQELSEHKQKISSKKKATPPPKNSPPNPLLKWCTFRQIPAMQKSFGTWNRTKAQALFAKPKPIPWAMYLNKSGFLFRYASQIVPSRKAVQFPERQQ